MLDSRFSNPRFHLNIGHVFSFSILNTGQVWWNCFTTWTKTSDFVRHFCRTLASPAHYTARTLLSRQWWLERVLVWFINRDNDAIWICVGPRRSSISNIKLRASDWYHAGDHEFFVPDRPALFANFLGRDSNLSPTGCNRKHYTGDPSDDGCEAGYKVSQGGWNFERNKRTAIKYIKLAVKSSNTHTFV